MWREIPEDIAKGDEYACLWGLTVRNRKELTFFNSIYIVCWTRNTPKEIQ